jgi:hypothetical protein
MHKLVDYKEEEVRLFVGVIDSLLRLLAEAKPAPSVDLADGTQSDQKSWAASEPMKTCQPPRN